MSKADSCISSLVTLTCMRCNAAASEARSELKEWICISPFLVMATSAKGWVGRSSDRYFRSCWRARPCSRKGVLTRSMAMISNCCGMPLWGTLKKVGGAPGVAGRAAVAIAGAVDAVHSSKTRMGCTFLSLRRTKSSCFNPSRGWPSRPFTCTGTSTSSVVADKVVPAPFPDGACCARTKPAGGSKQTNRKADAMRRGIFDPSLKLVSDHSQRGAAAGSDGETNLGCRLTFGKWKSLGGVHLLVCIWNPPNVWASAAEVMAGLPQAPKRVSNQLAICRPEGLLHRSIPSLHLLLPATWVTTIALSESDIRPPILWRFSHAVAQVASQCRALRL